MLTSLESNEFVAVASKNAVKLEGTRLGLQKLVDRNILPEYPIKGASVDSQVPAQPYGHQETKEGALNRIAGLKAVYPDARFWVSIESGAVDVKGEGAENPELWEIGYIIVECARTGKRAIMQTMSFKVPSGVTKYMREGYEMGDAANMHYGVVDAKSTTGIIGLMTKGAVTRTDLCVPAIAAAFSECISP
jgi:inosine/xanthosine triphosphatase